MQHRGNYEDTVTMFIIMLISGLLSAMYIWADNLTDVRVSLNDFYMAFLMASWMLVGMGLVKQSFAVIVLGFVLVIISFFAIRNQTFISQTQYVKGMIPHHSMAVFMSKKLLEKGSVQNGSALDKLASSIIKGQQQEITILKDIERY